MLTRTIPEKVKHLTGTAPVSGSPVFVDFDYYPAETQSVVIKCTPGSSASLQISFENNDATTIPTNWLTVTPNNEHLVIPNVLKYRYGVWVRSASAVNTSTYEMVVTRE